MVLTRLLSVPAFALRTTAVTATILAHAAQQAATTLATPRSSADASDQGGPDFLDLSGGGGSPYGTARSLAQTAPGWAEMADGAASEAAIKGGAASDGTTAAARRTDGGPEIPAPSAPAPVVPAAENPHPASFDPARITSMPVRDAIAALEDLSLDELRAVYDHEAANRDRKTILRAIEGTLSPAGASR